MQRFFLCSFCEGIWVVVWKNIILLKKNLKNDKTTLKNGLISVFATLINDTI